MSLKEAAMVCSIKNFFFNDVEAKAEKEIKEYFSHV